MSRTDGVFVIGIEGTDYHRVGYLEGASQTLEKLVGLVQESVPGKVVVDKWLPGEHEADAARLAKEMLSAGGKETATGWIEGSKGLVASITEFHNPCHAPDGRFCATPSGGGISGEKQKAGWLPDPSKKNKYRFYDGTHWTEHVADKTGADPSVDRLPVTEGSSEKAPTDNATPEPPKTGKGGNVLSRLIAQHKANKEAKIARKEALRVKLEARFAEIQAKHPGHVRSKKGVNPNSREGIKRRIATGELEKKWYGGRVIKKKSSREGG